MRFYGLEKLINLHDGYRRSFRIDQHALLLLQEHGECWLIEGRCPHRGHDLLHADLEGSRLRCPRHGYCFSLDDGRVLKATEEPCRALQRYELVYQGNEIGVML